MKKILKLLKEAHKEAGSISRQDFPKHNQKCQILIAKTIAEIKNRETFRVKE